MTVVVQGFGNVGYHAAKLLSEEGGANVICIIERDGYVFSPEGLDIGALVKRYQLESGGILGFEGAESNPNNARGLEIECDILIPAAMEAAITRDNAHRIRSKLSGMLGRGDVRCRHALPHRGSTGAPRKD